MMLLHWLVTIATTTTTTVAATTLAEAEIMVAEVVVVAGAMVEVEATLSRNNHRGFHLLISSNRGRIHGSHGQLHHVHIRQQVHHQNSLAYLVLGLIKPILSQLHRSPPVSKHHNTMLRRTSRLLCILSLSPFLMINGIWTADQLLI